MIIGLCGLIGSGKDTAADWLVQAHGFKRDSYAATLKDTLSSIFGWDRAMLEGATPESRAWRNEVDQWWADRLGIPELTPRWTMQNFSTEVVRKYFHQDVWIASLENRLRQSPTANVVITDCRFPNELALIKEHNGLLIRIKRGDEPEWWPTARSAAIGNTLAIAAMRDLGIHESEWAWIGNRFDATLSNDGTKDDLWAQLDLALSLADERAPIYVKNLG